MITSDKDTIVAISTPLGVGALSVIRISGPSSLKIALELLSCSKILARYATVVTAYDDQGRMLDQGVGLFFAGPKSYTGEDVFEFQGHGGIAVTHAVLNRILELGARCAEPGEFSKRAFLNNKLDLAQAEAVADLIHAQTLQAVRSAARSLQGEFSILIHALIQDVIHIRTYVEANIDFSDEEIDLWGDQDFYTALNHVKEKLVNILRQAKVGAKVRDGLHCVLLGKPNVGKSSLANIITGHELSIVTDIAGTTRDILRETLDWDGLPIILFDTAGVHEHPQGIVETIGIERSYQAAKTADIILYVLDKEEELVSLPIKSDAHVIIIINKIDQYQYAPKKGQLCGVPAVWLSAKENIGIDLLKLAICEYCDQLGMMQEGIILARSRHLILLQESLSLINGAFGSFPDCCAELLRQAQLALENITGECCSTDDLLGKIFSTFCIGK